MILVALVDTNVVVSGALAVGTLPFILPNDLLAEYRAVLLRPAIVARHRLTVAEVDAILEDIVANAGWREPAEAGAPAGAPAPTVAARGSAKGEDKDSLAFASRTAIRRLAR